MMHLGASYNETNIQILLAQFKTSLTQLLANLKKVTKPSESLLESIKQGAKLKKVPKPEEKPKLPKNGGLQETLGESELIEKAKGTTQKGQTQQEPQGASEQEWELSEKEEPKKESIPPKSKPAIPEKPKFIKPRNPVPVPPAIKKPVIIKQPNKPKASPEIAGIDFKALSDQGLLDMVEKYKDAINQFSLKQLLDIAADKDTFDSLDPEVVNDLKDAARKLKDEAEPAQRAALKFRYGIA